MRGHAWRKPSPAMVIAMIALFVALGGTGYAASQATNSAGAAAAKKHKKKTANDNAQDKSLFKGYLAANAVPKAKHADTATTAGGAPPTGAAGGALSGSYPNPSLAALPAVTPITSFSAGVSDYGEVGDPAGYYKDALGIVHLTGAVAYAGGAAQVFTLPTGFRGQGFFAVSSGVSGACTLEVFASGAADTTGACASPVGLDGITFRPQG